MTSYLRALDPKTPKALQPLKTTILDCKQFRSQTFDTPQDEQGKTHSSVLDLYRTPVSGFHVSFGGVNPQKPAQRVWERFFTWGQTQAGV